MKSQDGWCDPHDVGPVCSPSSAWTASQQFLLARTQNECRTVNPDESVFSWLKPHWLLGIHLTASRKSSYEDSPHRKRFTYPTRSASSGNLGHAPTQQPPEEASLRCPHLLVLLRSRWLLVGNLTVRGYLGTTVGACSVRMKPRHRACTMKAVPA